VNPGRRVTDGGLPTVAGLLQPKSRSPSVLTIALLVLVNTSPSSLTPTHVCVFLQYRFMLMCCPCCFLSQGVIILIAYFNSGSGLPQTLSVDTFL
jgi:hypothetical protein